MKRFLDEPNNISIVGELLERQVNSFMASYAIAYNKTISVPEVYFNPLPKGRN